MSENTKDKAQGYDIDKDRITSQEALEAARRELEYYKAEIEWITKTDKKEAIRQVNAEALKIIPMITGERGREQQHFLSEYYRLITKKDLIESERYLEGLEANRIRLEALVRQAEIDSQSFSIIDILKSFIGLDARTKEARRVNRILVAVRRDGLPKKVNLDLTPADRVVKRLMESHEWAGEWAIVPEIEQTALTISDGELSQKYREFYALINIEQTREADAVQEHKENGPEVVLEKQDINNNIGVSRNPQLAEKRGPKPTSHNKGNGIER